MYVPPAREHTPPSVQAPPPITTFLFYIDPMEKTNVVTQRDASMIVTHKVKIIFAGESGIGKSTFVARIKKMKTNNMYATIGVDFAVLYMPLSDSPGHCVQMFVWDVAGQHRYEMHNIGYFRNFDGAVLMYSIADVLSYNQLRERWVDILEKSIGPDDEDDDGDADDDDAAVDAGDADDDEVAAAIYPAPKKHSLRLGSGRRSNDLASGNSTVESILVGNKRDLAEEGQRAVGTEDAQAWANDLGIPAIECSCLHDTNEDIEGVLVALVTLMLKNPRIEPRLRLVQAKLVETDERGQFHTHPPPCA